MNIKTLHHLICTRMGALHIIKAVLTDTAADVPKFWIVKYKKLIKPNLTNIPNCT